jgi:TPR repeat protein
VWYTKSAEQGNAEAQYDLHNYYSIKANEYIRTTDNRPRIEEARKIADEWCLKAAEGGCISAQGTLAHDYFYSHSKGAARINDLEEAKKWYTKLAEKGSKQDEKMIGQCDEAIKKEQRLLKTTKSK